MRVINDLAEPGSIPDDAPTGRGGRIIPGNPYASTSFDGHLLWTDLFGETKSITREQALTIPGVTRGRGILLSLIADAPLLSMSRVGKTASVAPDEDQPRWLHTSPGWAGPYQRMARSLDDHIFYGHTLWGCVRGTVERGIAPVLRAWHIPIDDWELDPAGRICVLDEDGNMIPADESEVIYIPASHDGLLATASRTMRGAVELETSWISKATNPIPALDLHETEETNLEHDERQEIVDDWAAARRDPNGAIASTPYNIEARVLGTVDPQLFIEGRNAVRLDIANFFQLPAAVLDATTATASLTYTTQDSAESSIGAMSIPYWARPFEDRLGQDDIVPIGRSVRFGFGYQASEPPTAEPEPPTPAQRATAPDIEPESDEE